MSKVSNLWEAMTTKLTSQKSKAIQCQLCENVVKSSAVKCLNCNRYLHKKCLERACMLFDVSETNWECRDCANSSPTKFALSMVKKENESLRHQAAILSKLVSELDLVNCLQREKIDQFLGQNVRVTCSVYSGKKVQAIFNGKISAGEFSGTQASHAGPVCAKWPQ